MKSANVSGRFDNKWEAGLVALAALAVSCGVTRLLWDDAPARAIGLHIGLCGAICAWWRWVIDAGRDARLPAMLVVSTAVAGPFGAAGTLLTLALGEVFSRTSMTFEEWYESLFPTEETGHGRGILGLVKGINALADGQTNVLPLNDILSFGSFAQKQAAVTLITKYYKPSFAPVLKKALADESNAIRVQAATAMAKIEAEFLSKMMTLSREAEKRPGDKAALGALAAHFDDYAFSGVLDPKREVETRGLAVGAYQRLLALEPSDAHARSAVGRLFVRQRMYAEAAEWYGRYPVNEWPPVARLWHMESLFALGRYAELRLLAAEPLSEATVAPNAERAVAFWGAA
jgi:hypothetical protein